MNFVALIGITKNKPKATKDGLKLSLKVDKGMDTQDRVWYGHVNCYIPVDSTIEKPIAEKEIIGIKGHFSNNKIIVDRLEKF